MKTKKIREFLVDATGKNTEDLIIALEDIIANLKNGKPFFSWTFPSQTKCKLALNYNERHLEMD